MQWCADLLRSSATSVASKKNVSFWCPLPFDAPPSPPRWYLWQMTQRKTEIWPTAWENLIRSYLALERYEDARKLWKELRRDKVRTIGITFVHNVFALVQSDRRSRPPLFCHLWTNWILLQKLMCPYYRFNTSYALLFRVGGALLCPRRSWWDLAVTSLLRAVALPMCWSRLVFKLFLLQCTVHF